jgi:dTDP-glucose 4,6-dehydratase
MTKVVYITGCFGFIGSYVTRACLDKGWYVRGVDYITYAAIPYEEREKIEEHPNFKFELEDIRKLDHLYDCDYIINTAAETHVDNSIAGSKVFLKSNVEGVYNLLELIRLKGGHKLPTLIHFSTDEVYGDIENGNHKETDILKPSNPYSATKAAADMLIQAWHRTYNIPYLIVRPTNNYGIGQYVEKLIPRTIKCFNLGQKIQLHNHGTPKRTWLHASDTAEAIIHIIESGYVDKIFNIGGDTECTNLKVVEEIIKNYYQIEDYKLSDYIDWSYSRPGQDVRYSLDDSNLRSTGWMPKQSLFEEIPNIVEHYKDKFIW